MTEIYLNSSVTVKLILVPNIFIIHDRRVRKSLNVEGSCRAFLSNLSQAFNCLPQDLVLAEILAYGFEFPSITLIHSYLNNTKQRDKFTAYGLEIYLESVNVQFLNLFYLIFSFAICIISIDWFEANSMKTYSGKYHLLLSNT